MKLKRSKIQLKADHKRVIVNFLNLGIVTTSERITKLIQKVLTLPKERAKQVLKDIKKEFASRHSNFDFFLQQHFKQIEAAVPNGVTLTKTQKQLLGAFFTKEYSIQGAALFNPSIIEHPNQADLKKGEKRFLYTLRSVGEGHISSIEFRSGVVNRVGAIQLEAVSPHATVCTKDLTKKYQLATIKQRTNILPSFNAKILEELANIFTIDDYYQVKKSGAFLKYDAETQSVLDNYLDTNYDIVALPHTTLSERVIFPNAKKEAKGMEDVRMVAFKEGDKLTYIGTYTAYDGHSISPQLLITDDFIHFQIRTMYGAAVNDKGMALFPEKINGQYVMLGRQGGENITLMYSDDLYSWQEYETLLEPEDDWGLIQLGNCGSPIKTKAGWLVMTHAVGALRKYVIGAILLDLKNPSKIIKKLKTPLIAPNAIEREGYVPNVVYSCGSMIHKGILLIPYAMSDAATTFATVKVSELLAEMEVD